MDLLLHPADDADAHRPSTRGRLSSIGHGAAFRAFAAAARVARIRFMVIGGTYRDVAVRAASTRDIDVVLVDSPAMPEAVMRRAGFHAVSGSPHVWRFGSRAQAIELQIAAIASSQASTGPFSVAYRHAQRRTIEGRRVAVPRIEDYVILKLLAAAADARRRHRDLADIQFAFEAHRDAPALGIAPLRARLRDEYGIAGARLRDLVTLLRTVPRAAPRT